MAAQGLFSSLALLFEYPGAGYLDNAGGCGTLIARSSPWAFDGFNEFLNSVEALPSEDLEELFTRTFDLNPSCALEIGWHLFGEDVRRGAFLVWMRDKLRAHGLSESGELPDHLSCALSLVENLAPDDADEFAATCLVPALDKMIQGFGDGENPYKSLLECIRDLAAPRGRVEEEPANA